LGGILVSKHCHIDPQQLPDPIAEVSCTILDSKADLVVLPSVVKKELMFFGASINRLNREKDTYRHPLAILNLVCLNLNVF
jgi:hypothetical protein